MKNRQLFPLGKAYGDAFCNRIAETGQLLSHLQQGKHTLIIAPRRYGKSSLAERAIEQSALASIKINFHLCTSESDVSEMVLDGVIKLIGKSIGQVEKLISFIKKYVSTLEPLLSFGGEYATLQLIVKNKTNYAVIIAEALLLLEKLLFDKNKKAIIFFDEFQEITKISKKGAIEGAFRTAAQEMKCLSIIFSGSIRSVLLHMFEDENRPLYKLCRKIKLDRIDEIDYEKHIQKIAMQTWGDRLHPAVFNKIMVLSNRHPYYVNYLCDAVWEICKKMPAVRDVDRAWAMVVTEEWSDALRELSELSAGQRRLLKYIANNPSRAIHSQKTCVQLSMPGSSVTTALRGLIEKDYVEQHHGEHHHGEHQVINPLLLAVLRGAED